MPRLPLLVLAALFVGCSSNPRPVDLSEPVTATSEVLSCVRTQLQESGYAIEPTTGPTTVTGIRIERSPRLLKWIGFRDTANQITATVAQGQLRVTAISADPNNPAEGGLAATGTTANRQTEDDAQSVVSICA